MACYLGIWTRAWIAQELFLATRVIIFTNSQRIPYEIISSAFSFLSWLCGILVEPQHTLPRSLGLYWAMVSCVPNMLTILHSAKSHITCTKANSKTHYLIISVLVSKLEVTDPRDYIYGLLGLTQLPI
jgi:hypothetical protein